MARPEQLKIAHLRRNRVTVANQRERSARAVADLLLAALRAAPPIAGVQQAIGGDAPSHGHAFYMSHDLIGQPLHGVRSTCIFLTPCIDRTFVDPGRRLRVVVRHASQELTLRFSQKSDVQSHRTRRW